MIHPSVCSMCPLLPKQVPKVNDVSAELLWIQSPINVCTIHQIPSGLVVRIRRSHRRVPGSIPHLGTTFFDRFKCDLFFFSFCPLMFWMFCSIFHNLVFIHLFLFSWADLNPKHFKVGCFLRYECSSKSVLISIKLNKTTGELSCLFYAELSNFSTVAAVTASDS